MTTMMNSFRIAAGVAAIIVAAVVFGSAPAAAQNQHMEIIHHPNYDKNVFMPFVPAIKIKSGKKSHRACAGDRDRQVTPSCQQAKEFNNT